MRLDGRAVLVTGASRGIGRAIALACAREGAAVAVNGRDAARVDGTVAAVGAMGRRAIPIVADVSNPRSARAMVEQCVAALGRLDVFINNAGVYQRKPILDIDEDDWDTLMATNLRGAFFAAQAAARAMVARGHGAIVNVASDATWTGGFNTCAHYCASKAGLVSLTRSFAKELAARGVRVNAVAPGMIATDMGDDASTTLMDLKIPLGHMGTPDEVAEVVVFLASDESRYMTGTVLNVTGGLVLDR